MRWWLLGLALVVGVSLVLGVVRPGTRTVGARMVAEVEQGSALRGAVPVVMEGGSEANKGVGEEQVEWGVGGRPGEALGVAEGMHWARGGAWWSVWSDRVKDPLKDALGTDGDVRRALGGYAPAAVDGIVNAARKELEGLTDEGRMKAWLKADRARVLEMRTEEEAAREILLLTMRKVEGPVVVCTVEKGRVYLLAVEGRAGAVELWGYDRVGKLAWAGVLEGEGLEPAEVRRAAVAVARLAYGEARKE